jgi:hypothetical protein
VIGWRPYLLTLLAAVLLAVMALDVTAAARKPAPKPPPKPVNLCAPANALQHAGFHREAERRYQLVLATHPEKKCPLVPVDDPNLTP